MKGLYGHPPEAEIAYLPQAPQIAAGQTLRSLVTAGMGDSSIGHKADAMLMQMGLDPMRVSDGLSGGEARRVSLARALYTKPHILLLDEPTNHMDLPTIEWMEDMLLQHQGALLVVSHDRAFLRNLGTGIIWLQDGKLRRRDGHFDEFEILVRWHFEPKKPWCFTRWIDALPARPNGPARAYQPGVNAIKGGFVN